MKKYSGIRHIEGNTYEYNFRPFKRAKRIQKRIQATSMREAAAQMAELLVEARKKSNDSIGVREIKGFDELWLVLERDLISQNLPTKTKLRYKKTFYRMFKDFRDKEFPAIDRLEQLSLPFFAEYRNYYSSDLGRLSGWRAELIIVKAMINRFFKLGYCPEAVKKSLLEIKKPKAIKKEYPEISNAKIKEVLNQIKFSRPDLYGPSYFMLRTGRRVEETTLIERKDVKWDGINPVLLNIRAETTKMDIKAPLKLLDDELRTFIRQAYQNSNQHKSPYLFLNHRNKKCDQRKITEYLGDISEKMLKVRITSHYFRHRFCTECGKANLPPVDVMAICGLRDVNILLKYYSHSTDEGLSKVLESTKV